MRTRRCGALILALGLGFGFTALTAGCSRGGADSERGSSAPMTESRRDSTIAASKLPGAGVMGRATALRDSSEARAKRIDDGQP